MSDQNSQGKAFGFFEGIQGVGGALAASVAFGAVMGLSRKVCSIGGNIIGGYLTDKFGTAKIILLAFLVMLGGNLLILLTPLNQLSALLVSLIFIVIVTFFHMNYAMAWTMMSEGAIPLKLSGTAAGIICTAGAIPETFVSILAGKLIDNHRGELGFRHVGKPQKVARDRMRIWQTKRRIVL